MKPTINNIAYEKNSIDDRYKTITSDVTDGLVDLIEKVDNEIDELSDRTIGKDELYDDEELNEFLNEKKQKLYQIMNMLGKTLSNVLKEE